MTIKSTQRLCIVSFIIFLLVLLPGLIYQDVTNRVVGTTHHAAVNTDTDRDVLSLISWNVHGAPASSPLRERVSVIASLLKDISPDVILLQEVFQTTDKSLFVEVLGDGYDFIDTKDMIRYPNHMFIGGLLGDRKSGLITLLRKNSPWKLVNGSGTPVFYQFTSNPDWLPYIWQGDRLANKGLLQITIEKDGQQLVVINTHFQANYGWAGEHHDIRTRQILESLEITEDAEKDVPVIFAGDINVRPICTDGSTTCPDSENYHQLTGKLMDLTLSHRTLHNCDHAYKNDDEDNPDCFTRIREKGSTWIDYVFISPDYGNTVKHKLQVLKNTVPDYPYSDHNGLYLTLYE